jgi:hypothetical protein
MWDTLANKKLSLTVSKHEIWDLETLREIYQRLSAIMKKFLLILSQEPLFNF